MANVDLRDFIQYVSTGFASLQDIMNLASDIGIDPQTAISVVQQVQPTMLPTNPFAGNYTTPTQEYSAPRIGFEEAVSMMVSGFCRDVFNQLPMEFAAEADKLLALKLEGSVG